MLEPLNLVRYLLAKSSNLPPIAASMYEYILAGNGIFIRAAKPEMSALVPVIYCEVRGLAVIQPYLIFNLPRVRAEIIALMLERSRVAVDCSGKLVEILFHLLWDGQCWQLEVPVQVQTACRCKPLDDSFGSSYQQAVIEVHSHGNMSSMHSTTDNADETGFRIYAVLGKVNSTTEKPELRVRVGVYGNYLSIPASSVFELPNQIADALLIMPREDEQNA